MSTPAHDTSPLWTWLVRVAVSLALLGSTGLHAAEVCGTADGSGVTACRAGLSSAQVETIRVAQEKSQWCWAASISMVFAHYGHNVPQEGIVRHHFGDVLDQPVPGDAITSLLAGPWADAEGRPFAVNAAVAHAPDKRPGPAHETMVAELSRQRPLLIGVSGHAMVLVRVDYERHPGNDGVRITGGMVIDPRPGRGLRRLLPNEARPSYVAAVRVSVRNTLALAATAEQQF